MSLVMFFHQDNGQVTSGSCTVALIKQLIKSVIIGKHSTLIFVQAFFHQMHFDMLQ